MGSLKTVALLTRRMTRGWCMEPGEQERQVGLEMGAVGWGHSSELGPCIPLVVEPLRCPTFLMLLSFGSGSAYCGGLWLAAVCMMCKMAEVLGDTEVRQKYLDILNKGKEAFERRLWNGGCSAAGNCAQLAMCPLGGGGSSLDHGALWGMGEGRVILSLQDGGKEGSGGEGAGV